MDVAESADLTGAQVGLGELATMAQRMAQHVDVSATLQAVLDEASRSGLGDGVAILLLDGGTVTRAAASDPAADQAALLQVQGNDGPGVDTIFSGESLGIPDLGAADAWPCWASQAERLGWRSLLSVGLSTGRAFGGHSFGAVNFYRRRAGFDAGDLGLAEVFAVHASVAIAGARERHSLAQAMDARNLIGQAQGILMERYGVDAEQAFSVLRRYSSHGNRKLRHVAEDIVRTRRLPDAPVITSAGDGDICG